MQEKEKRETLADLVLELKEYYECQKQHKKFLVTEQLTHIISTMTITIVMAVLLLTVFAFLGMAAAHWLSTLFGSLALGFLLYVLFLLAVMGVFYLNRRRWIILPIARMMIHIFIKDEPFTNQEKGKETNDDRQ